MKIKELTKEQLMYLLCNDKPLFQGQFGILTLLGDKLYKIYYKELIDTYLSKDESKLDDEVETLLSVEEITKSGLYDAKMHSNKFEKLADTKMKDLITSVLSYRGLCVGVEMSYYKDYTTLTNAQKRLRGPALNVCLTHAWEQINELLDNNIVPKDIKEDNILVNITTLDTVIIDLDGMETVYGPDNYIEEYPYAKKEVIRRYEEMKSRILEKQEIDR